MATSSTSRMTASPSNCLNIMQRAWWWPWNSIHRTVPLPMPWNLSDSAQSSWKFAGLGLLALTRLSTAARLKTFPLNSGIKSSHWSATASSANMCPIYARRNSKKLHPTCLWTDWDTFLYENFASATIRHNNNCTFAHGWGWFDAKLCHCHGHRLLQFTISVWSFFPAWSLNLSLEWQNERKRRRKSCNEHVRLSHAKIGHAMLPDNG